MREEKAKLYAQFKGNKDLRKSKLYNMNFFRYIPKEDYKSINKSKKNKNKNKKKNKNKNKSKNKNKNKTKKYHIKQTKKYRN